MPWILGKLGRKACRRLYDCLCFSFCGWLHASLRAYQQEI